MDLTGVLGRAIPSPIERGSRLGLESVADRKRAGHVGDPDAVSGVDGDQNRIERLHEAADERRLLGLAEEVPAGDRVD
jgi:hypothetical protein